MVEYVKKSDVLEIMNAPLPRDLAVEYIYDLKGVWLDEDEADTPQTDDDYFLELMDAVKRGEMSDASANQAYYEYINKQAEESDTPQVDCN